MQPEGESSLPPSSYVAVGFEVVALARSLHAGQRITLAGAAHRSGIRLGHDPATNCRAHEVDNLRVVDAGVFPSSAALTIAANALRLGAHLAERPK